MIPVARILCFQELQHLAKSCGIPIDVIVTFKVFPTYIQHQSFNWFERLEIPSGETGTRELKSFTRIQLFT
jgi:hypothetical protein